MGLSDLLEQNKNLQESIGKVFAFAQHNIGNDEFL